MPNKIIPNQQLIRNQKNLASLLVDEAPGLVGETGTVCPEAEQEGEEVASTLACTGMSPNSIQKKKNNLMYYGLPVQVNHFYLKQN